jgi:hypothetical protein
MLTLLSLLLLRKAHVSEGAHTETWEDPIPIAPSDELADFHLVKLLVPVIPSTIQGFAPVEENVETTIGANSSLTLATWKYPIFCNLPSRVLFKGVKPLPRSDHLKLVVVTGVVTGLFPKAPRLLVKEFDAIEAHLLNPP